MGIRSTKWPLGLGDGSTYSVIAAKRSTIKRDNPRIKTNSPRLNNLRNKTDSLHLNMGNPRIKTDNRRIKTDSLHLNMGNPRIKTDNLRVDMTQSSRDATPTYSLKSSGV